MGIDYIWSTLLRGQPHKVRSVQSYPHIKDQNHSDGAVQVHPFEPAIDFHQSDAGPRVRACMGSVKSTMGAEARVKDTMNLLRDNKQGRTSIGKTQFSLINSL